MIGDLDGRLDKDTLVLMAFLMVGSVVGTGVFL